MAAAEKGLTEDRMMEWKKVCLEDKDKITAYLRLAGYPNCELTFTNILLWGRRYPTRYTVVDDHLIIYSIQERSFTYPLGEGDPEPALRELAAFCAREQIPLRFHSVNESIWDDLQKRYPGRFQIIWVRDYADYVYRRSDLAELKGKKYHGKRNHIHNFLRTCDWSYEPITDANQEECFEMSVKWWEQNGADEGDKETEMEVTRMALNLRKYLGLSGGLLRVDGNVAAFTLGEAVNPDTFVVHIEKAFADLQGAYPMINQQFVLHEAMDYTYINREDDSGMPGLRKAKLSYHPAFLLKKGYVTEKADTRELYEEVFPEDGKAFTDYYYSHKIRNNKVLTKCVDGNVVSMLHMNPYSLCINGSRADCYYLVAVATKKAYRRRGYMRELMEQAFEIARREDVPYLYLMPADPAIYEPFGFQFLTEPTRQQPQTDPDEWQAWRDSQKNAVWIDRSGGTFTEELAKEMTGFATEWLSARYDIYTCPSEAYYQDLLEQAMSENGGLCVRYDGSGKMAGFFFYCVGEYVERLQSVGGIDGCPVQKNASVPGIMIKAISGSGTEERMGQRVWIPEMV